MEREFARSGLGYTMTVPALATEFSVRRLARSRGELFGELVVSCGLPGTRSSDGHLHGARFNLSGSQARTTLAKVLAGRAAIPDIDWLDLLEDFCRRVLAEESAGEPVIRVGSLPRPLGITYRVDPVLPLDEPVIVYGEGGTGKSTLAAAIAVSVETGIAVIPGWAPRRAPVLYLDWEAGPDAINARVARVAMGANLPGPVSIAYRFMVRPLADQVEDIAPLVTSEGIGLVIVDSVGMALGGSSDGTDASEGALRLFAAFRVLRTTVLAIDHKASAGLDEQRTTKPYGSIYKVNMARAMFEVRRHDSDERGVLGLYNTKYNDRRKLPPIALGMTYEGDEGPITYSAQETLPEELSGPLPLQDRIAAVLGSDRLEVSDIASLLETKPTIVRAILNRHKERFNRLASGKWELLHPVEAAS